MKSASKSTKGNSSAKSGRGTSKTTVAKTKILKNTQNNHSHSHESQALKELFIDMLKDIYWSEKYLVKSLPEMIKAATSPQLSDAFTDHLDVTEEQVVRVERVFQIIGEKVASKKCDGMEGLVKEAKSGIEETEDGTMTRDVALIVAAQKVEHYEIAAYGGLSTLSAVLGYDEVADLLKATLEEEKEADTLLTEIAENYVNDKASQEA